MYVNTDYLEYSYVVDVHDNYITLSKRPYINGTWENPITISVVHQYFTPSIYTIEDSYTSRSYEEFTKIDVDDDFYSRADCHDIIQSEFILIVWLLFIINAFTRFFRKGGVFFGS